MRRGFSVAALAVVSLVGLVSASMPPGSDRSRAVRTQPDRLTAGRAACVDQDADGFSTCQGDCSDTNAAIHPEAAESCDQVDNNCNDAVDEGFAVGQVAVARIGDADDFDDADGDGVPNLPPGTIVAYPGYGNGETSGTGELFTDVIVDASQDRPYHFDLPRGVYERATLRLTTCDLEAGRGWNAAPILLDGIDFGFRLAETAGDIDGLVRTHEFELSATQLSLLADGALTVTVSSGDSQPGELAVADYVELEYELADCNANGLPDACDLTVGGGSDCNANGLPDECDMAQDAGGDCDGNGIPDACDLVVGMGSDCNSNGLLDSCDINAGAQVDCNGDGRPDDCPTCPPVELVFILDTSETMEDDAATLCATATEVADRLGAEDLTVALQILAIAPDFSSLVFDCVSDDVVSMYGTAVPGDPPLGNTTLGLCPGSGNQMAAEDWGRATSVVTGRTAWGTGTIRIVAPVSDEGPWCGDPVTIPGVDEDSVSHAIDVALENQTSVFPISVTGATEPARLLAQRLADQTGGAWNESTVTPAALADTILAVVLPACVPPPDCDGDGTLDVCEIADGTSSDCDSNGVPDDCEQDSDGDGAIDACDGCPADPDATDPGPCGCADEEIDTDGDGLGDCDDPDDDNDGVVDTIDPYPFDPDRCGDAEFDGCDDCSIGFDDFGPSPDRNPANDGPDADSDGYCDSGDGCPNDPEKTSPGECGCGEPEIETCGCDDPEADTDLDGVNDCLDVDDDNDGVDDAADPAALDPDACGDSDADLCDDCSVGSDDFGPLPDFDPANDGVDSDNDGTCDSGDGCPNDPEKTSPGECGCGEPEIEICGCDDPEADTDLDGIVDCLDVDDDNDGVDDAADPAALDPDVCGDSDADLCDDCSVGSDDFGPLPDFDPANDGVDSDGDGACDDGDACPEDPEKTEPGDCGCGTPEGCNPLHADAGGPYEGVEGSTVAVDGSNSSGPAGDPLTYEWDLDDDGEFDDAATVIAEATYADNGSFVVRLRLGNADLPGVTDTAEATVTVLNAAPIVSAGADRIVEVGDTVELEPATFVDPGTADTHTATIDWGDGAPVEGVVTESGGSGEVAGSHVYAEPAMHTVQVCVTDDDGATTCDELSVEVAPRGSGEDCFELNFESDADGTPLPAGTLIFEQLRGVLLGAENNDPGHPDKLILFDSADHSGGDDDLGSPNEGCEVAGPGVGTGGAPGEPGENCAAEGNVLVLAADDTDADGDGLVDDPDDESAGGTMHIVFEVPSDLFRITLIDIDEAGGSVRVFDPSGESTAEFPLVPLGDNSRLDLDLDVTGVWRIEIDLAGSGALASLQHCPSTD